MENEYDYEDLIELDWTDDEDNEVKVKPTPANKPSILSQYSKRVQYEGRFIFEGESCYFKSLNGKKFIVEGDTIRYKSQLGHVLMISALIKDPRERKPKIKVLSFI